MRLYKFFLLTLILFNSQLRPVVFAEESTSEYGGGWLTKSLAWSSDGTKIAVGGGPNPAQCGLEDTKVYAVRILDAATSQVIKFLTSHTCAVVSVAWSPDSSKLVTGSEDGTIIVWNVSTGQTISSVPLTSFGAKYSLSWNSDGSKYAAIDSASRNIEIRDANNGQLLNSTTFLKAHISSVDWSPDGTKLLTGDWDGAITIWDAVTGQIIQTLDKRHSDGYSDAVYHVIWSPDGSQFATSGEDDTIRIWNTVNGEEVLAIPLSATITNMSWAIDAQLVTSDSFNKIHIWSTQTGLQLDEVQYHGSLFAITTSPDGTQIAYGGVPNLNQDDDLKIVGIKTLSQSSANSK